MQPLSTKELNYIADLLGAEEMLIKTCVAASAVTRQGETQQFLHHAVQAHQRRYDELSHLLSQHENLAH